MLKVNTSDIWDGRNSGRTKSRLGLYKDNLNMEMMRSLNAQTLYILYPYCLAQYLTHGKAHGVFDKLMDNNQ